jgi:hypothetical protein
MNKCIIAASGHKNAFEVAVGKNYKMVVADCGEMLQHIIWALGWNTGIKDSKFYEFYNQLFKMANEVFDFKNAYMARAIQEFRDNNNSEVLIIKGSDELVKQLEEDEGIYNIFIAKDNDEVVDNSEKYDKVILTDNKFEDNVKQTLDILLNKENVNA